jgi:hypothetical protein
LLLLVGWGLWGSFLGKVENTAGGWQNKAA